jgi:hypothetical protein
MAAYLYFKDHGHPHIVIRKGSGKHPEAEVKIRIDNWEVLESRNFTELAIFKAIRVLRPYQARLMESWYEIQKK